MSMLSVKEKVHDTDEMKRKCSNDFRYLKFLLECVYRGVNDESQQVRNSALLAIGHFSEHLQVFEIVPSQPNTSKYH